MSLCVCQCVSLCVCQFVCLCAHVYCGQYRLSQATFWNQTCFCVCVCVHHRAWHCLCRLQTCHYLFVTDMSLFVSVTDMSLFVCYRYVIVCVCYRYVIVCVFYRHVIICVCCRHWSGVYKIRGCRCCEKSPEERIGAFYRGHADQSGYSVASITISTSFVQRPCQSKWVQCS